MQFDNNENPDNKPVREFVKKWNRAFNREAWVYKDLQTAKIYTEKNFLFERMTDTVHYVVVINENDLPPTADCYNGSSNDML
jgi:hypothetical protein